MSTARLRMNKAEDEGFTLIELLIVIVILGILAGIVVFAVGSAKSDSVASSCKADVKTVNTAAEAYKAKNGGYPTQANLTAAGGTLRTYPSSTEYAVAYTQSTGTATGTLTGGAAC